MGDLRERIVARVNAIEDLPSLGTSFLETQKLVCGKNLDASEAAAIIEKDVWLTARLLKIVNSVYYGGRYGEIGSLRQAVARLGLAEVTRICLAFQAVHIFPETSPLVNVQEFWRHSIAVAMVTRALAVEAKVQKFDPAEAYVAGLMHDIGMVVLDRYFNAAWHKVRDFAVLKEIETFNAERQMMDIDHGEVGGLILARWKLPESVVEAVSCHHSPERSKPEFRGVSQLVYLSDIACSMLGAGEPGDPLPQGFSNAVWYDLGLDADRIRQIIDETEEEIARTKILFNLL